VVKNVFLNEEDAMKRIFLVFSLIIAILSSSFFSTGGVAEARACNTGSYWKVDKSGSFSCSSFTGDNANTNALQTQLKNLSNGSDLSHSGWSSKFGRLMIQIAVIVSYATQTIALITIVYSAFLYTTSEGDLRKIRQAKMLILYAFTGMFIASFALIIANMLGGAL
jgi:hypothetical protein